MSLKTLKKLQKLMLFMVIIFLPLNSIPKAFAIPGLGGTVSNYFIVLAIVLLGYEYYKYRFEVNAKVIKFFVIFIAWQLLCLAIGLVNYKYNELLTLDQISKLSFILDHLKNFGIEVNELLAVKTWLLLRFSKDILLLNNVIFFITFYIWHIYKEDFKAAFNDVRKAVICLVVIMGAYSFIELLWLKLDARFGKEFLVSINPFLYTPQNSHGWWPPLLWKNQLRSICTEPSYFGILSILCLPFLWSLIFESRNKIPAILLTFYFTLMIAATNARTAIVLAIAEVMMFGIAALMRRDLLKQFFAVLTISVLAFGFNLVNWKSLSFEAKNIETYAERNVYSVTETKARSNSARLANLIANINVIKQYPVFGVGTGLKDAYLYHNLPEFSYTNYEVRNWSRYLQNEGVLKAGYPPLNKYADIAVLNGLPGLVLYFLPLLYLLKKLLKHKRKVIDDDKTIMLLIAAVASLGAMMSNNALVICSGIVWGLLYCKVSSVETDNAKK